MDVPMKSNLEILKEWVDNVFVPRVKQSKGVDELFLIMNQMMKECISLIDKYPLTEDEQVEFLHYLDKLDDEAHLKNQLLQAALNNTN